MAKTNSKTGELNWPSTSPPSHVSPIIILRRYVFFVDQSIVPSAINPGKCLKHITEHYHIAAYGDAQNYQDPPHSHLPITCGQRQIIGSLTRHHPF